MHLITATRGIMRYAALATALVLAGTSAQAQEKPTATAMATAKEIIDINGSMMMFNPLVAGVVEQTKNLYLQQNPNLNKEINEVAASLRAEYQPRLAEVKDELAKSYATSFTEPELVAILAFYNSPVGRKLIDQQPKVAEKSMRFAQDWANKLSEDTVTRMRDELKKRGHTL